nr:hypothetical protein [Tanacetum cinerariifolium]
MTQIIGDLSSATQTKSMKRVAKDQVLSQRNKMTRPREAKGKRPVESFIGYRDLSAEFEDYSEDIINKVNAASTLVPAVGKISPNS